MEMKKCDHNEGCHWTHGFECEKCGRFIPKNSDEYKSQFGLGDLWMVLNNINADLVRSNRTADPRVDAMMKKIGIGINHGVNAIKLYKEARNLVREFNKNENSASITLK